MSTGTNASAKGFDDLGRRRPGSGGEKTTEFRGPSRRATSICFVSPSRFFVVVNDNHGGGFYARTTTTYIYIYIFVITYCIR